MLNTSLKPLKISQEELLALHKSAPRYTSYPTAPNWEVLSENEYLHYLMKKGDEPLSIYVHIPFCEKMCLFCGCSVILNRKKENEERYVAALCKEIDLYSKRCGRVKVSQVHFGGGTPTKLESHLLIQLMEKLEAVFEIDYSKEIAIEIDPRTVSQDKGEKLQLLKKLGFNRVSFGVQDTDPQVQKAINRNQSKEVTRETFERAVSLGFDEINIDLIYGLPYQTETTFKQTVSDILSLRPDRIALFSYAKVPWLKAHQNAIKDETLPSTEEKFSIYSYARTRFIEAGYVAIGMDHFALVGSELALSYKNKTLNRNFQGYTVKATSSLIGLGVTSIGYLNELYVQNLKELTDYYASIENGVLPVHKGKILTSDDQIRKWVIMELMCRFELCKLSFKEKFGVAFDTYFQKENEEIKKSELVVASSEKLSVTPKGELFVRNVAMIFDRYLHKTENKFSKSI